MKSRAKRKPRMLREQLPPKLLAAVIENITGYKKGSLFAKKSRVPYQNLYVIKTTGRGTKKDIEKIQKVLKAA